MLRSRLGLLALLLGGCRPADDSGLDTMGCPEPVPDTGDSGGPWVEKGPGIVVLAGGGSEGELGDAEAWSARLYGPMLAGGDVTGDGLVRVAVLSTAEEDDWLPRYLEWLGADEAFNLQLETTEAADACRTRAIVQQVDAVFLKGGDQGAYYDLWNDTALEEALWALVGERGGGIGGTSAGAMSLAGHALAGGQDLVSLDVLEDACTPWLDDASDGGSAIHDDFLGFVPGTLIDTHFTQRGRLGRLAGAMARAIDEGAPEDLLGIGLEQQTGLVVRDGRATVVGDGAVSVLQATDASMLVRDCGHPLVFTELRLQQLTEGWGFDAVGLDPLAAPADAEPLASPGPPTPNLGAWAAYGDAPSHQERFAWVAERSPFALRPGEDPPVLEEAVGVLDAHRSDDRALAQEVLFRALYEQPGVTGFLLAYGSMLDRPEDDPALVLFEDNDWVEAERQAATLVVTSDQATFRSLAPGPSLYDSGDGSLHAAGLSELRLHVLADSARLGLGFDAESRLVVGR